ncbi:MAG TPA: efflux RND transporter periplasmic adaptor subunit [Caulobacteraceae bacterium]|nr:efflux RND transporter periplasmic adaptor subunit [Caulobacteraceae bacterium]
MSYRSACLLVPLGGMFAVAACSPREADDPRLEAPAVQVATVAPSRPAAMVFTGVVSARVQSDLGFRTPGKVVARLVDAGQTVRHGQPLMRIDPTDYTLALAAQSRTVDAARARAVQTAADEARFRDLVAAGAVSASAYDQIKASALAADAELRAAEAQAKVAQDQAGYSVLVADADGVVVETLAEPGQVVAAGQTVVKLAHAGPREATVDLPETVRPTLGSGAEATVFGSAGATGQATLRQLSDAADPQTRTFEARYVLSGAAAQAPLGATVTLRLPDPHAAAAAQAPLGAIYDPGGGPGVWIIDPRTSTVSFRRVRLGGIGEETATVVDGLRSGDRFVALGAHLLRSGEQVRVAATSMFSPPDAVR